MIVLVGLQVAVLWDALDSRGLANLLSSGNGEGSRAA
jgi:hypothetical protein